MLEFFQTIKINSDLNLKSFRKSVDSTIYKNFVDAETKKETWNTIQNYVKEKLKLKTVNSMEMDIQMCNVI